MKILAPLLLVPAVLAIVAVAALAGVSAAPVSPSPAALDLPPLPAPLAGRLRELTRTTERLRGLEFRREVKSGALDSAGVRRWIDREMAAELPPAAIARLQTALAAFGFVPPGFDLGRFLPDLLSEQIGGFYDTEREVLVLVEGAAGRAGSGEDPSGGGVRQMDEMVLVHELTHALDDQVFGLPESADAGFLSDRTAARDALTEGDATLVMMDFMLGDRIEDSPHAGELLAGLATAGASLPSGPEGDALARAPAYFRDTLLFSYFRGLAFCAELRQVGGQRLLDHAFAHDPPQSSEQILHPEKWHDRRDDPLALAWPDLAGDLPGWTKEVEGELGEFETRLLLAQARGAESGATAAAAGWGGDRFAVYRKGGKTVLLWWTEWDTAADADEFAAAAGHLPRGWSRERLSPTRVALLRGDLPAATRRQVLARLASARADKPASRDLDFKALGIEKKTPSSTEALRHRPAPEPALLDPDRSCRATIGAGRPLRFQLREIGSSMSASPRIGPLWLPSRRTPLSSAPRSPGSSTSSARGACGFCVPTTIPRATRRSRGRCAPSSAAETRMPFDAPGSSANGSLRSPA
jgi:hypothetical protein